jgi:hypothetical protein
MTENVVLIETSFADAIAIIAAGRSRRSGARPLHGLPFQDWKLFR